MCYDVNKNVFTLFSSEAVNRSRHRGCSVNIDCDSSTLLLLLLLLLWRAREATAYMGGQRCPEEMRKSTRLWIRRDPSLPRDSWQPFYWLEHHSRAAVVARSWRIVDHCQTIDVDGCRSSCSRFSDSVVGFTGQKTQPTASKYWSTKYFVQVLNGHVH